MQTQARLIVDIARLDEGGEKLVGDVDSAVLELDDLSYLKPVGPLHYDLVAQMLGDELLVKGRLSLPCSCVCARCACDFEATFEDADYCESFEILKEDDFFDLTDSLRECIIVSLPFYPHCREDCRGLCPGCGADLNREECRCAPEAGNAFGVLGEELPRE